MASPISCTIDSSRCWMTDTVMRSNAMRSSSVAARPCPWRAPDGRRDECTTLVGYASHAAGMKDGPEPDAKMRIMTSSLERAALLRREMERRILVLDGAMGTMIQSRALDAADFGGSQYEGCNEHLNLTRPDVIRS